MDDIGLHMVENQRGAAVGHLLVKGMPKLLAALSTIGIIAMLWVGGHIILNGLDTLGWHLPHDLVHHAEEAVAHATGAFGPFLAWLVNTAASFVIGLVVGAVVVAVLHVLPFGKKHADAHAADAHEA